MLTTCLSCNRREVATDGPSIHYCGAGAYAACHDGIILAFEQTYDAAEKALQSFDMGDLVATATALDGGSFDPPGDDPAPETGLGSSSDEGDEARHEALDVCPSCGDQLSWQGPGLCGTCQEAGKTFPFLLALS